MQQQAILGDPDRAGHHRVGAGFVDEPLDRLRAPVGIELDTADPGLDVRRQGFRGKQGVTGVVGQGRGAVGVRAAAPTDVDRLAQLPVSGEAKDPVSVTGEEVADRDAVGFGDGEHVVGLDLGSVAMGFVVGDLPQAFSPETAVQLQ